MVATALFGPKKPRAAGRAATFLVRTPLKDLAAPLTGDFYLVRRRSLTVVMGNAASIAAKFAQCLLSTAVAMAPFGALLSHVAWVIPSRLVHGKPLDLIYNLTCLVVSQNRSIIDKTVFFGIKQQFIETKL